MHLALASTFSLTSRTEKHWTCKDTIHFNHPISHTPLNKHLKKPVLTTWLPSGMQVIICYSCTELPKEHMFGEGKQVLPNKTCMFLPTFHNLWIWVLKLHTFLSSVLETKVTLTRPLGSRITFLYQSDLGAAFGSCWKGKVSISSVYLV